MSNFETVRRELPGQTKQLIKQGGFATVEEVETEHGLVARKRLNPDPNPETHKQNLARFHREVELIQSLHFPYVVEIKDSSEYAFGDDLPSLPAYTMQLATTSLEDLWTGNGKTDHWAKNLSLYLSLFNQAALALSFIHANQIIHRDIKPGNFLIYRGDRLRLCDFGIANGQTVQGDTLTRAGTQLFSKDFVSPEQAKSLEAADKRSDIYSFGASLFYLSTGEAISYSPSENAQFLKQMPDPLAQFIEDCTHFDPNERIADGTELVLKFRTLYNDLGELGHIEKMILHPSYFEAHARILQTSENRLVPLLPMAFSAAPLPLGETCDLLTQGAIETIASFPETRVVVESFDVLVENYLQTTAWSNAEKVAKVFSSLLHSLDSNPNFDPSSGIGREFAKKLAESVLLVSARLNRFEGARWFLRMFAEPSPLPSEILDEILGENPGPASFLTREVRYERINLSRQASEVVDFYEIIY